MDRAGPTGMPALGELQREFCDAVLDRRDGESLGRLADAIVPDGLRPEARVAIHRHHVLTTLASVLRETFPVVNRLVGDGFFAYAADGFVRQAPPRGPCLFEYGAGFPDFLAAFSPCRGLVYLPDVARLEWAMHAALHAEDAPATGLDGERAAVANVLDELRNLPADRLGEIMVSFDPSASYLSSSWPIDRIWCANQPGADPEATLDLRSGGVCLEVRRLGDDVVWRTLPPAEHAFRSALADDRTLERAAEAALAIDPAFDLAGALRGLIDAGLVVGLVVPR